MLLLKKNSEQAKNVAVIVAHPDDETLWTGGTILSHPLWTYFIISLCRGSDADRSARFNKVLEKYNCDGVMGDLDDGVDQNPVADEVVQQAIINLLPQQQYDLIITHNPLGEYTRHLRHEEVSKAVINLWEVGGITTREMWIFAYSDKNSEKRPLAMNDASLYFPLSTIVLQKKQQIISEIYGFDAASWEAKATPKIEAFYRFSNPRNAKVWLEKRIL